MFLTRTISQQNTITRHEKFLFKWLVRIVQWFLKTIEIIDVALGQLLEFEEKPLLLKTTHIRHRTRLIRAQSNLKDFFLQSIVPEFCTENIM